MKPSGNIKSTHDFEPFGVELEPIGDDTTNLNYKYTGQERDNFTNFDYMHFRFYASSTGRFLKPDNIIPDITNPQNWNGYSYVKGNPINFNDPSGHETPDAVQQSSGKVQTNTAKVQGVPNLVMEKKLVTFVVKIVEPNKSVTAVQISVSSENGKISVSVATAKENTTKLTDKDLNTMRQTVQAIYDAKETKNVSKEVAVAVAMRESRLGVNASDNPMQFTGKGWETNTLAKNIEAAISVLDEFVGKEGLYEGLRAYNWGYVKDKVDYEVTRFGKKETAHPLKESTAYANQVGEILDYMVQTYRSE